MVFGDLAERLKHRHCRPESAFVVNPSCLMALEGPCLTMIDVTNPLCIRQGGGISSQFSLNSREPSKFSASVAPYQRSASYRNRKWELVFLVFFDERLTNVYLKERQFQDHRN